MAFTQASEMSKEQQVIEQTRFMVYKHYVENDAEAIIAQMDKDIVWFGAAEQEYATGIETVAGIFRQFGGQVPRCNISDEEYQVLPLGPEVFLCTGRMWISTDASTLISLRVHQRITTIFRWVNGVPRCCHIHISNPYQEMKEGDVGFPVKMARQSYEYLQEQIEVQKRQLAAETAVLQRMSFEDTLTGLHNRNKFNQVIQEKMNGHAEQIGVACFDLNGLKEINDQLGHSAGDILLRQAAEQLVRIFQSRVYRTGGDEFVVIDDTLQEQAFEAAVKAVQAGMQDSGISCSVGFSWRSQNCNIREQLDEADERMYEEKRRFYSIQANDRRNRRRR